MKYVVAVAIVAVLLWVLRSLRRRPPAPPPPSGPGTGREPVPMLRCAACGVHLAASEAVRAGEAVYCCDEHRAEGRRHGG